MSKAEELRRQLIDWNNTFPLDHSFRKKTGIIFNSEAHRAICQIDVYIDWLEEELFKQSEADFIESYKKEEQFKKGIWIAEDEGEQMTDEDFDSIVI